MIEFEDAAVVVVAAVIAAVGVQVAADAEAEGAVGGAELEAAGAGTRLTQAIVAYRSISGSSTSCWKVSTTSRSTMPWIFSCQSERLSCGTVSAVSMR